MKKSQGLVEYILVFVVAALAMYYFASQFDLNKLKTFAIFGVKDTAAPQKIIIPPMTK